jgi:hypothetical protein
MAVLGASGRRDASKALVVISASLVPTACVVGPILAWNNFDRGRLKIAITAIASPILMSLFCVLAATMTY